jgi:hypothetical protein
MKIDHKLDRMTWAGFIWPRIGYKWRVVVSTNACE